MKSNSLLVLACLVSMPVFAQSLPDEINYGPYETRYRTLERETSAAQSQLNQSRSSLAEAQKFIREMTAHIADLESDIDENENEIARLQREIPELERLISNLRSEDSRVMNELRNKQQEENNLVSRYQQAERELRPMEAVLQRKEQRLRELQSELSQYERAERDAALRVERAQGQAQRLERQIADQRSDVRKMQEELRSVESRISSIQSQISSSESSLGSLNSSLNTERAKLGALNNRVSEYEAEVSRLRSSGGTPEQIAQAERKLNAARGTRDSTAQEIRTIESQISRSEAQIRTLRSQIDELRRSQSTLPSRISQAESRINQLESERRSAQAEISRFSAELQNARRNVEQREQNIALHRNDMRSDEQNILRHRQFMENVARQIEGVRSEISSLNHRSRNLNAEIARASETARSHQAAIPRLELDIRSMRSEIAEGQRDLVTARNDERNHTAAVARDESKLADLTRRRDSAQGEMSQRLNLYNRYLTEAESLGSSQAGTGTLLGEKEGERLSQLLSKQNGVAVGRELGTAEAKHWGHVRGEIEGYDLGYSEGLASTEDINRANAESSIKAAADAELFAQTNFKPVFFEEFVQQEFKKPLFRNHVSTLKSFNRRQLSFQQESFNAVSPLSPAEISRSDELKTPLDSLIVQMAKDVKAVEAKARRLSDPEVTFETPSKIPFGTASCTQVYKGLAVFKAACEGSYKGSFTNNYVLAAKESFSDLYTAQFTSEFDASNLAQREASYPAELNSAGKVGRAEGVRVGKIEIYQTTYAQNYKTSYVSELEKARLKAKGDAQIELAGFLKVKPLLTVAENSLSAENFRGGEEVSLLGKVKNVGSVALNGPVLVRVTEVINAEMITGEAVLNTAAPLSLTDLPALKVKVLGSARAGEKMIVRGVVDLPGDLYRPSRQEKFELSQVLSANPAHDLGLNYNKNPDIKGVFRRNIHFLTVKVTPMVEDIKEGYKLTVSPVGEGLNHTDMRDASFETGAMKAGTSKDVRFSYVFKDSAKGKAVQLELSVSYLGKVIKKELIVLNPK